jgi:heavy metal sensor kinase
LSLVSGLNVRTKLTLGYVLALALALMAFSCVLYFLFRNNLYSDLDVKIRNDLELADDHISDLLAASNESSVQDPENWLIEVWDEGGNRRFSSSDPKEYLLGQLDPSCLGHKSPYNTVARGLDVRIFCQESSMGGYILRVARLTEKASRELEGLLFVMVLGTPLIVLLASGMGYLLARRALKPVADMTQAARQISASSLSERLPVSNPKDELGMLAQAFNESFDGLERSFHQMKRFTSDASHELRTPLTAIRTLGEVTLNSNDSKTDARETIANILEESDRLGSLCESLLTLSRGDAGQAKLSPVKSDLKLLISEVAALLHILAEERGQTLKVGGAQSVYAEVDPPILKQAITNLVDNAIKYCPEGAQIEIGLKEDAAYSYITVGDNGPGIAEEHRSKIFERFYRVDHSRSRSHDGSWTHAGAGLGLAIASWAVELHRGSIRLKSEVGIGSEFTIVIPKSDQKES